MQQVASFSSNFIIFIFLFFKCFNHRISYLFTLIWFIYIQFSILFIKSSFLCLFCNLSLLSNCCKMQSIIKTFETFILKSPTNIGWCIPIVSSLTQNLPLRQFWWLGRVWFMEVSQSACSVFLCRAVCTVFRTWLSEYPEDFHSLGNPTCLLRLAPLLPQDSSSAADLRAQLLRIAEELSEKALLLDSRRGLEYYSLRLLKLQLDLCSSFLKWHLLAQKELNFVLAK